MKRVTPLMVLLLAAAYLALTGFQCGSAEITTAKLAMQQKDFNKAEESLMKEVAKNPKNEEAWFLLGQVRHELKKYGPMNEAFTNALAINSTHKEEIQRFRLAGWAANYNEGIGLYNKGREDAAMYDRALEAFSTAIMLNPDSASTYYVAGLTAFAKKDYPRATELLETALKKDPTKSEAAILLGDLHLSQANIKAEAKDMEGAKAEYSKAGQAYEMAYKVSPSDPDVVNKLIGAYELSEQPEKVMKLTTECIATDPKNRLCRYAYGLYLIKRDRFEEGIEQFNAMLEINPAERDDLYTDAVYNMGVAYQNWGVAMKKESDRKVEESKGKVKEDLTYKEKFRSALRAFEKVAEAKKEDPNIFQAMGRLYANLNMPKEAKAAFDTADRLIKEGK